MNRIILLMPVFVAQMLLAQSISDGGNKINLPEAYPSLVYDSTAYTIVGGVMTETGTLKTSITNYRSTEYIDVEGISLVKCSLPTSVGCGLVFFDSDKNYLTGYCSKTEKSIVRAVPENARYIRASYRADQTRVPFIHLYKSAYSDSYQDVVMKLYRDMQGNKSQLGAIFTPNYKVAIGDGCFLYNAVNNGIGYVDSTISEVYQPYFRIPTHIVFNNGDILVAAEVRREQEGMTGTSIGLALSEDAGESWRRFDFLETKGSNPNLTYDKKNDRVILFVGLKYFISSDHGQTWTAKGSISSLRPDGWEKMYPSPTKGIQLENGILATPFILMNGSGTGITENCNIVVFSRDFGETWEATAATPSEIIANETTIAEYESNQIMINARGGTELSWSNSNPGRRVFIPSKESASDIKTWAVSKWVTDVSDKVLPEPVCNASFISAEVGKHRFGLFCNPRAKVNPRRNLFLRVSADFHNWTGVGLLTEAEREVYGYCSLCYNGGRLSFVYEDKEYGILFCDLTDYMDEVLTKMIANKMIYQ